MDVIQMQLAFLQKLKNDYNVILDIPTIDIEYYLTEGQRRVFEKWYELFETSEKARKVLSPLVLSVDLDRATYISVGTGQYPYGEYWTLPTDLAYTLKEEATININACEVVTLTTQDWLRVYTKPINLDYYSLNVSNPFKKPYSGMVWRVDVSDTNDKVHMLITGGNYRVETYHITYLSYPTAISIQTNTDTLLSEIVHQDIVDEATKVVFEVLQLNNQFIQPQLNSK